MLFYIKDTLLGTLRGPDNGWVTSESKDWKQLGRVLFEWHITKKLPCFDTIIVCYLLGPFKVKKFALWTLPNVSLNLLENWLNRQYLKKMACGSVITDYFINFFLVVVCRNLLLWVASLQLKETLKPWVSVNFEKNFALDSSGFQTLILGVNTGGKMYHWKVILCSNIRGLCSENTC